MDDLKDYGSFAKEWAEMVRSGKHYSHRFYEKPAMITKLPDLHNKIVLCIGCGTGEECNNLLKLGAKKVVGIDPVKEMIDLAKSSFPEVDFQVMDMRDLDFEYESFDFAYSSLALHYIKNWVPVLTKIHKILKNNGTFLFSTHHFYLGASQQVHTTLDGGQESVGELLGYQENNRNNTIHFYGDYNTERKITQYWFGGRLKAEFYHKTLQSMVREIVQSNFEIIDVAEPLPQKEMEIYAKNDYQILLKMPYFLIFEIKKK